MKNQTLSDKRILFLFFFLVFAVMLVYSCMTPMLMDDFSYCFSWEDNARVRNPLQIIGSMRVHRQVTNGRVFAHGLVQFLLMLPKAVFNFLNAANAVLLSFLYYRHFRELSGKRCFLLLVCGAFLVFNYLIGFGQVFLWLDGSVNYSWGISLLLLFLWPYTAKYLGLERKRSILRDLLFFPLAFIAGAYSENSSLATLFAALCLTVLTASRQRKVSLKALAGLLLGGLGFAFLMSAPASAARGAGLDLSTLAGNLKHVLEFSRRVLLPLYVVYGLCLALALFAGADRRRVVLSGILVLAGIGSVAAFVFALYFVERHFCCAIFFTVLAVLLLLSELLKAGRPIAPLLLTASMSVLFLFNFSLGTLDITHIYKDSRERLAAIETALAAGQRDIVLEVYMPYTEYSGPHEADLSLDPKEWPNFSVADYYGFDHVTGAMPEE